MRHMQILLVEDEIKNRLEFKEYISSLAYPNNFYMAEGESDGLKLVQKFSFDVIILDLELHESDGDGIGFLKKLKQLKLPERPYIIVVTNNSSAIARDTARDHGADYIFWKRKIDYSPKLVMDNARTFYECKMKSAPKEPIEVEPVSLEDDIKTRISKIGINSDMYGRNYIIESITIVVKSNNPDIKLHRDVFPIIAKKHSKSIASVNRAIENAINKAWCITDEETRAEYYPGFVSGMKGTPTNKELIFSYADEIKDLCKA